MRRRIGSTGLALLAGIMIGVSLYVSGATSGPSNNPFGPTTGGGDIQYPVEQQSGNDPATWVRNPTGGCVWDVDDYHWISAGGDVTARASIDLCLVADTSFKPIYAYVFAPRASLSVSVSNDQGASYTLTPGPRAKTVWGFGYAWQLCTQDHTAVPGTLSSLPIIPDSNGGRGIVVGWTLTLVGTQRDVHAQFEASGTLHSTIPTTCGG